MNEKDKRILTDDQFMKISPVDLDQLVQRGPVVVLNARGEPSMVMSYPEPTDPLDEYDGGWHSRGEGYHALVSLRPSFLKNVGL